MPKVYSAMIPYSRIVLQNFPALNQVIIHASYPTLLLDVGVGVQRTRLRSLSRPDPVPAVSVLFANAPDVLRSNNLLAAGVRFPAASARLGVHEGGPIFPFDLPPRETPGVCSPVISAFALRLFEAELASLRERASRDDISRI